MTRVKISVAILLTLVTIAVISGILVDASCGRLRENLLNIEDYIDECNLDAAKDCADELSRKWEKFRCGAEFLLKNEPLCTIDTELLRLRSLITEHSRDASAELHELLKKLEKLGKSELPLLTNIL